jgi:hypothetical protein
VPQIPTRAAFLAIIEGVTGQGEADSGLDRVIGLTDWEQIQVAAQLIAIGVEAPLFLWSGDETYGSLYDKIVAHNIAASLSNR